MSDKYSKAAERLKALAESTRLKILKMLSQEEMCVCEIIDKLHLSQPAVSHHLKILRQADIITDRKAGKWVFYSLNRDEYLSLLEEIQFIAMSNKPVTAKHEPSIYCPLEVKE